MSSDNNNPQILAKKEADLFKHLVKHYEAKQYKKAIKQADAILRKVPNHGETLAMKGLTLYYFAPTKKEEAHELVKLGLRYDMRSHVCWHVYGLLHRADRNYLEAIKAYKQALRMDADNLQILRDLSLLQIQMRDLHGFVKTRNAILTLKPNAQLHWLSFSVAKHLVNDVAGALQVIDIYLSTLTEGSELLERNYEPSELQLYKSLLLLQQHEQQQQDGGGVSAEEESFAQKALDHLESCKDIVMDTGAWLWHKVLIQFALGEYQKVQDVIVERLFPRGATEDYRIHAAYQCAVLQRPLPKDYEFRGMDTLATTTVLTSQEKQTLLEAYTNTLAPAFPKSKAIARIPLTVMEEGDALAKELDAYLKKGLQKGVPSLASDLSSLLLIANDDNKSYRRTNDTTEVKSHFLYTTILRLVQEFMETLKSASKDEDDDTEPSTLFWALFFQANWFEFGGEYTKALQCCEDCLTHTPTAVDVYEVQARLYQKSGAPGLAVTAMDKGRTLDQQDRYMNNMTTRFMLQNNMPELALERIGLFTNSANKEDDDPNSVLYDMQCSWYELELGDCLTRQGDYGKALQKYAAVMKHFEDIHEDQFDFHSYCIRKVTLRAYCNVLEWEDELWGQPYYRRAAEGTIGIYLKVHDDPSITAAYKEPDYTGMSAAEKKKAKAIARKKKKKAENEKKNDTASNSAASKEQDASKELLLKDALEECQKLSAILSKHAPLEMSTWMLQYDVAIRRGKALMALQALHQAHKLDKDSSELLTRIVDFASRIKKEGFYKDSSTPVIQQVIESEFPTLLNGHSSVADYVKAGSKAIDPTKTSLAMRIALMKAVDTDAEEAAKLVLEGGLEGREGCKVETCRAALAAMKEIGSPKAEAQWIGMVKKQFPLIEKLE